MGEIMIIKLAITSLIALAIVTALRVLLLMFPISERVYLEISGVFEEIIIVLFALTVVLLCAAALIKIWG
jgi:hypothetical protein